MDFCNLYDVDGKSNCLGVWGTAKKVGILSPRTTERTQWNFILFFRHHLLFWFCDVRWTSLLRRGCHQQIISTTTIGMRTPAIIWQIEISFRSIIYFKYDFYVIDASCPTNIDVIQTNVERSECYILKRSFVWAVNIRMSKAVSSRRFWEKWILTS